MDRIATVTRQFRVLTIDLTRRLPDIDRESQLPSEFDRYGRFAVLRTGVFWFGDIGTSHPSSTQDGFYWALAGDRLYLSPRGSTYRWLHHITDDRIRMLLGRLGIHRRYREICFVGVSSDWRRKW